LTDLSTEAAKPPPEEDAKAIGRAALNLCCKYFASAEVL
jgi:hypothetical protein